MKVYTSTFCNFGHDLATGRPIDHECYILPPKGLEAERTGDFATAQLLFKKKGPIIRPRSVK